MRNNYKVYAFIGIFFLCLCLPKIEAATESVKDLPFANPDVLISMDFQDANLKDILKIFSIQSGLNFVASDSVKDRKFTLYFDNVPIKDAMDKIFKANNLSYELDKESNIFIVTDLGAPEVLTVTRIFYLKFASVSNSSLIAEKSNSGAISDIASIGGSTAAATSSKAGIASVVEKLLSTNGKIVEDARTNCLIVTDIPSRMDNIAAIIASLDIPQPQILLEVEMMDVTKGTTEKLGVKFPQQLLDINMSNSGASWYSRWPQGSIFGDPTKEISGGGKNIFSLGSTSYDIVIDFLKTQTDTKFLARPRILTLNNETAEIKIVTDEAIGVSTTTSSSEGNSTETVEAERTQTGVLLRVTPQINLETNEITMFVIPAVAEASTNTVTFDGHNFKNPDMRYTKSNIRVRDGETVVMGGLMRKSSSETVTKLPFFSDIPLVGKFFTHKSKDPDSERELLVFITPHIIRDTTIQLAQAKKGALPEREQGTASAAVRKRQEAIDESLKIFETKKK